MADAFEKCMEELRERLERDTPRLEDLTFEDDYELFVREFDKNTPRKREYAWLKLLEPNL